MLGIGIALIVLALLLMCIMAIILIRMRRKAKGTRGKKGWGAFSVGCQTFRIQTAMLLLTHSDLRDYRHAACTK